jgi:hypothetical protein
LAHLRFLTQPWPTSPVPHAGSPASRPSGLQQAFPSPPSLTYGPRPHLPPSGKPTKCRRPPRPGRASPGHHLSPRPWREVDPPCPLPLPLLYWPPLPPSHPITDAHRHQWRCFHFTVTRSPPSSSAPIKGAPAAPHLTTPHTTLPSSSLMLELAPTARLQLSPRRLIARPPHRRSPSGEALDGTPMLHSPSPTPWPSA